MMISAVFTLLLAGGATVLQVSSRPVLLVAFDGINASFISTHMERLDKDGDIGRFLARPSVLKSENPTKSFPVLHTVATGVLPNVHGVISNTKFNKDGKMVFGIEEQLKFNRELKPLWTEAVLKGIKTATYVWPGANIKMQNTTPDVFNAYTPGAKWNSHISAIKKWFKDDSIELGMAYFEHNWRRVGAEEYITKAYSAIQNIYEELKDFDVDIIIMSTNGKKEIWKDKYLNIHRYVNPLTCKCDFFMSGGISFIRFEDKKSMDFHYSYLKTFDPDLNGSPDNGSKFLLYKSEDDDVSEYNLKDSPFLRNTLIIVAIDGHALYNGSTYGTLVENGVSHVRESGYSKNDTDMDGILILKGASFKDNVVANGAEIQLTEVYQLVKKLLGLNDNASTQQRVEDLSDNMKQLIEDKTLEAWGSSVKK